jgi:hypothetical protein
MLPAMVSMRCRWATRPLVLRSNARNMEEAPVFGDADDVKEK